MLKILLKYKNKQTQNIISGEFENSIVDFDGTYVYVFKTLENSETTTKYLQRVNANSVETSQKAKFETVASVLEKDQKAIIKAKEEAEKARARLQQQTNRTDFSDDEIIEEVAKMRDEM